MKNWKVIMESYGTLTREQLGESMKKYLYLVAVNFDEQRNEIFGFKSKEDQEAFCADLDAKGITWMKSVEITK